MPPEPTEPDSAELAPKHPPASASSGSGAGQPAAVQAGTGGVSAARSSRLVWQKIEEEARELAKKPARTVTIAEATRSMLRAQKAAARFAKYDLRNEIASVLGDPAAVELDLSANTQLAALTPQQKVHLAPSAAGAHRQAAAPAAPVPLIAQPPALALQLKPPLPLPPRAVF